MPGLPTLVHESVVHPPLVPASRPWTPAPPASFAGRMYDALADLRRSLGHPHPHGFTAEQEREIRTAAAVHAGDAKALVGKYPGGHRPAATAESAATPPDDLVTRLLAAYPG